MIHRTIEEVSKSMSSAIKEAKESEDGMLVTKYGEPEIIFIDPQKMGKWRTCEGFRDKKGQVECENNTQVCLTWKDRNTKKFKSLWLCDECRERWIDNFNSEKKEDGKKE